MSESLSIPITDDREVLYQAIGPQIQALLGSESDEIARMANFCAVLHTALGILWTGFYRLQGEELVLGPFQGPVACSRFSIHQGVCGAAVREDQTIIVEDVDKFPGHIACSSLSKSEIVIPWRDASGKIKGVLDLDSEKLSDFSVVDQQYLEQLLKTV